MESSSLSSAEWGSASRRIDQTQRVVGCATVCVEVIERAAPRCSSYAEPARLGRPGLCHSARADHAPRSSALAEQSVPFEQTVHHTLGAAKSRATARSRSASAGASGSLRTSQLRRARSAPGRVQFAWRVARSSGFDGFGFRVGLSRLSSSRAPSQAPHHGLGLQRTGACQRKLAPRQVDRSQIRTGLVPVVSGLSAPSATLLHGFARIIVATLSVHGTPRMLLNNARLSFLPFASARAPPSHQQIFRVRSIEELIAQWLTEV